MEEKLLYKLKKMTETLQDKKNKNEDTSFIHGMIEGFIMALSETEQLTDSIIQEYQIKG